MTDNEIRIAIIEACGWARVRDHWEKNGEIVFLNDSIHHRQIPNYPKDLNACHEVWKTLPEAQKVVFGETLCAVVKGEVVDWGYYPGESEIDWGSISILINATAQQRAEAFLRTVGKWRELETKTSP